MDRTQAALERMATEDPQLAARLFIQMLPAVAQRLSGPLTYDLAVEGLGTWRVAVDGNGGGARVERINEGSNGHVDFTLAGDAAAIAGLAARQNPLRLMASGKLHVTGKRRRLLKLRALADGPDPTIADALAAGAELDADAIYRALPYLIDPEWTRGHTFTVAYEVEGVGAWCIHVRDGEPLAVTDEAEDPDARVRMSLETYRAVVSGSMTPPEAMQRHLIDIEGGLFPTTLLGRWIDRSQGRDDAELEREQRQRAVQERRLGSWGGVRTNGTPLPAARAVSPADGGDPAHESAGDARRGGDLMGYGELYALWERQNWKAHELDFSVDREQWLVSPAEAQEHTTWSLGSFYIGEERVTADLAPFLLAAPSGEVEVFLATQLVDEARHAAFFDRFGAEVMALDADDLRGRLTELQTLMKAPWFDVFDDGLREVADRIKARPDDLGLFVEGVTTYHLIIEGVLAMTGQRFILKYMEDHDMFPGFQKGFSLVEQDEHRHIAFGVRFLKDAVESDPRFGEIVQRRVEELVPRAAGVFVPPYVDDPREFTSYGYHSSHIYGFAYRKLKRRMAVLGLEVPPPEDLMPGPIASPEEARAAGAPV
ncbi:MAG: ribonucleoside-diphosphate reductase beta chain [Thermoleophilaceae bacterium]|nr:ribonucleoside-diphosphate reductase beta chain [Thermoleophilaceae bacterium]